MCYCPPPIDQRIREISTLPCGGSGVGKVANAFKDPGTDRWADGSQKPNVVAAIPLRQSWLCDTGHLGKPPPRKPVGTSDLPTTCTEPPQSVIAWAEIAGVIPPDCVTGTNPKGSHIAGLFRFADCTWVQVAFQAAVARFDSVNPLHNAGRSITHSSIARVVSRNPIRHIAGSAPAAAGNQKVDHG